MSALGLFLCPTPGHPEYFVFHKHQGYLFFARVISVSQNEMRNLTIMLSERKGRHMYLRYYSISKNNIVILN